MSIITAIVTFALLHARVQAQAFGEIKLGCLSAVPTNTTVQTKSSTLAECSAFCAGQPASYAYYAADEGCSCSDKPAENTMYVRGADVQANCTDESVWYTGLVNSTTTATLTTTCPYLGPRSPAQMKGYKYISILPSPLTCYSTCTELYPGSSVTLIQPGMGGVACACAEEMTAEGYTDVCGAQSWYAVRTGSIGSGSAVGGTGGKGSRRKRVVRR